MPMTSSSRSDRPSRISAEVVELRAKPLRRRPPASEVVEGVVLAESPAAVDVAPPAVAVAPAAARGSRKGKTRPCKTCGRETKGFLAAFGLLRVFICSKCVKTGAKLAQLAMK